MQLFGLIGHHLSHSLSPALHRMMYEYMGLDAAYGLFDMEPALAQQAVQALKTLGIRGANVTSPHKLAVMDGLDEISPEAAKIGAVNTISIDENRRATGYNTDYYGFLSSLEHGGIAVAGKSFLLCGMSGAGRAVYHALTDQGAARIVVASTDPAKGISYTGLDALEPMDVIVNCTPLGMGDRADQCAVQPHIFEKFSSAVDLIYNPAQTLFLKQAEQRGLKTLGGLYMLIYQGMKSLEIWTGQQAPRTQVQDIHARLQSKLDM